MKFEIKPFVKWVGGKRQIISEIEKRLPKKFNCYYEPFVGGGALFMHLQNNENVINDYSEDLINVYEQIKKNPIELMQQLDEYEIKHSNDEKFYYDIRNMDRENNWNEISLIIKAARFIYLNKACFNGLYRVNKAGYFNVPSNGKRTVKTYEKDNITRLSEFLNKKNIKILSGDFEIACKDAKKGDFIFFDPPYDLLNKSTFDSYNKDSFGVEGQKRLAKLFKKLDKKGCYVMLTNHNTELINELYKEYTIDVIKVRRAINSDASKRTGEETIIYNYSLEDIE